MSRAGRLYRKIPCPYCKQPVMYLGSGRPPLNLAHSPNGIRHDLTCPNWPSKTPPQDAA